MAIQDLIDAYDAARTPLESGLKEVDSGPFTVVAGVRFRDREPQIYLRLRVPRLQFAVTQADVQGLVSALQHFARWRNGNEVDPLPDTV